MAGWDAATALAWCVSPKNSMMTGQLLSVDDAPDALCAENNSG